MTVLESTKDQEKRIVSLENQVAAVYDRIYNIEDDFRKDAIKAREDAQGGVVGKLFGQFDEQKDIIMTSQLAQLKQRVRNAMELQNELEGEMRILKQEENTILFNSDVERINQAMIEK